MESLDAHLAARAAEGERLDSGAITLNTLKARERIARYALAKPGFWLVKLVQAAVACGAEEVRITFSRRVVKVVFENKHGWTADAVLEAVLTGKAHGNAALHHLRVGLTAAMGLEGATLTWSGGGRRVAMLEDRTESSDGDESTEQIIIEAHRPAPPLSMTKKASAPLSHLFKQTAHEFMALVEKCRVCPIPLWVDGYRLHSSYLQSYDTLPKRKDYDSDSGCGLGHLLAVKPLHCWPDRPSLGYPLEQVDWGEGAAWADDGEHFATQIWKPGPGACQGVACLYTCAQHHSQLVFTQDGAELERRILPPKGVGALFPGDKDKSRLVLRLYLEVRSSEVDLSEFQVRELDMESLLAPAVPDLVMMMQGLRTQLLRPWKFQRHSRKMHPHEWSALSLLGVTGLVVILPPLVGLVGVSLLMYPLIAAGERKEKERRKEVLETLLYEQMEALEDYQRMRSQTS